MNDSQPNSSPWAPLRNKTFLFIWIATIASNIGTWMHEVGASWLMLSMTSDPVMIVLIQSATALPIFLFALPAGALSDIIDRRVYLLAVQSVMLLIAILLTVITFLDLVTPWTLVAFTFALACGTAFSAPAWQAITPELVPRKQLTEAISLNSAGINISRAIGPALGGLLVALYNPAITFFLNSISFIGILIILYRWQRQPVKHALPAERLWNAIKTGLRYSKSSRSLKTIMVRAAAFFIAASAVWALLPLLAKEELKQEASGFGLLVGAIGLGAMLGSFLLPRLRAIYANQTLVIVASVNYAVMVLLLAFSNYFYIVILIMVSIGVSWITVVSSLNAAVQHAVPDWVRSRALAAYLVVFFGAMALGSWSWGVFAKYFSISDAFIVAGALQILGVLLTLRIKLPKGDLSCLESSGHWPTPVLASEVDKDQGPVMITIEYQVEVSKQKQFKHIAKNLREIRKRDGAFFWELYSDVEKPESILEAFMVESWLDHLRQHERVTNNDKKTQDHLLSLCRQNTRPVVRHMIHSLQ